MSRRLLATLPVLAASVAVLSVGVGAEPGARTDWVAYPPKARDKQIVVDGNSLTIKADPSVERPIACTTPLVDVADRVRVTGDIHISGLDVAAGTVGVLVDIRFLDAAGERVPLDGTAADILRTDDDQDWTPIRSGFVVPKGAVSAKVCATVRGTDQGTLSIRDLRIGDTSARAAGNGNNVLLVVVDTLRSDMLGAYGQKRPLSPNVDRFARDGRLVSKAWTQYTWTTPSFVSYMTSQYARTHGWTYGMGKGAQSVQTLATAVPTLAQALSDSGYITVGFYANPRVRGELGMGRGFESWRKVSDTEAVDGAIEDIGHWKADGAPNLLYVHLMTTHVTLFPSDDAIAATGLDPVVPPEGVTYWANSKDRLVTEQAHLDNFQKAYMASVWDADRHFGRLLEALEANGEADRTFVAFFADHGELLGEHGLWGHGPEVYEPLTSVPLILRTPGRGKGAIDDRVGELVDVAPTVLDHVGLADAIPARWQGRSLLARSERLVAASERNDELAVTPDGRFKVVQNRNTGELIRAFDLRKDPGELNPLALDGHRLFQGVVDAAERWRAEVPVGENHGTTLRISKKEADDELEALKALGYVE